MVSTLRLYNVYKKISEIVNTQLCNINCPNMCRDVTKGTLRRKNQN